MNSILCTLGVLTFAGAAAAAPLELDASYGRGGTTQLAGSERLSGSNFGYWPIAAPTLALADGRVMFAGVDSSSRMRVLQLNAAGRLDTSFGASGSVVVELGIGAPGLAVTGNARILVGGAVRADDGLARVRVLRLNSDGSLDRSFGRDGFADLEHPHTEAPANAVRLATDDRDRIRVVASCSRAGCGVQSWRLLPDGAIDPAFTVGSVSSPSPSAFPAAIEAMPDGSSFALVFDPEDEMDGTSRLLRFAPDGQPTPISTSSLNVELRTLHRRNSSLYVGGFAQRHPRAGLGLIARLDSRGELTREFGTNGVVEFSTPHFSDVGVFPIAIVATASEIWVAGRALAPSNAPQLSVIVKLAPNGVLDASFANGGVGQVSTSHAHYLAASLSLDQSRRLVLSGFGGTSISAGAPVASRFRSVDDLAASQNPGVVAFSDSSTAAAEAARAVSVRVLRTGGSAGAASVEYETVDVTASEGADYRSARGRLDWADGDASDRVIDLQIIDDANGEPDEGFTVKLQNPSGVQLSEPSTVQISIRNDDPIPAAPGAGEVSVTGAIASGNAGGGGSWSGLQLLCLLLLAASARLGPTSTARARAANPKRRPSAWIRSYGRGEVG